jgi:hypothetical protein
MDKLLKSAIAVGLSIVMLAIAAYLTLSALGQHGSSPSLGPLEPTQPAETPTQTHASIFVYTNPNNVPVK